MAGKGLLNDLAAGNLDGIGKAVEVFLHPVLKSSSCCLDEKQSSSMIMFSLKFIHSSLSHITSGRVTSSLLHGIVQCCECLALSKEKCQLAEPLMIQKLLYNIVTKLQQEEFLENLLKVANFLYDFMKDLKNSSDSVIMSIISGGHLALWNLATRLEKNSPESLSAEMKLILRQTSLQFLRLKPGMEAAVHEKFVFAIYQYETLLTAQNKALNQDSLCFLTEIIDGFILLYQEDISTKGSICINHILQLYIVKLEYYMKLNRLDCAKNLLLCFAKLDAGDSLSLCQTVQMLFDVVIKLSSLLGSEGEMEEEVNSTCKRSKSSCSQTSLSGEKENKAVVENLLKLIQEGKQRISSHLNEKISAVEICTLKSLWQLMQQTFGKLSEAGIPQALICEALEGYDTLAILLERLENELNPSDYDGKTSTTDGKQGTIIKRIVECHYKKLQIAFKHIQLNTDKSQKDVLSLCEKGLAKYQQLLNMVQPDCSEKQRDHAQYNCGYINIKLGNHCASVGLPDMAVTFYSMACSQLSVWCKSDASQIQQRCQQANLSKVYECLVDCHKRLQNWQVAMDTIIQSLVPDTSHVISAISTWVKVKKEAINSGQEQFFSVIFSKAVEKMQISGLDPIMLLKAELGDIKKFCGRKMCQAEMSLLEEIYNKSRTPVDKATALVEMTEVLTYIQDHNRSPNICLDQAVELLLKEESVEALPVLAVAYFWKYLLQQEEALKYYQKDKETYANCDKDEVGGPDGENNKDRESGSSLYTFNMEKSTVVYLDKALQAWELYSVSDSQELMAVDRQFVHTLMLMGTVYLAMRKPKSALKAMKIMQLVSGDQTERKLKQQITSVNLRLLIQLGKFEEAQQYMSNTELDSKTSGSLAMSQLLQAELAVNMGQINKGVEILNQVLQMDFLQMRTRSNLLLEGQARRLLAMCQALPTSHMTSQPANHYALSLSQEAVRAHMGVFKTFLAGESTSGCSSLEKWSLAIELLESLLQLGALYRLIGESREASFYLKEGLRVSQMQGLPRWSSEFLLELMRVQNLSGNRSGAAKTITDLQRLLSTCDTKSPLGSSFYTKNPSPKESCQNSNSQSNASNGKKSLTKKKNQILSPHILNIELCFGFKDIGSTPKAISKLSETENDESMEQNEFVEVHFELPQCPCNTNTPSRCDDGIRHRLCIQAGLNWVEYLTSAGHLEKAADCLKDLNSFIQKDFNFSADFGVDSLCEQVASLDIGKRKKKKATEQSRFLPAFKECDPHVKSLILHKYCLEASVHLRQKNFQLVSSICEKVKKMEDMEYFENVVHGNEHLGKIALLQVYSQIQATVKSTKEMSKDLCVTEADVNDIELEENQFVKSSKSSTFQNQSRISDEALESTNCAEYQCDGFSHGDSPEQISIQTSKKKSFKMEMEKEINGKAKDQGIELDVTKGNLKIPVKVIQFSQTSCDQTPKTGLAYNKKSKERVIKTPLTVKSRKAGLDFLMEVSDEGEDSRNKRTPPRTGVKKQSSQTGGIICSSENEHGTKNKQMDREDRKEFCTCQHLTDITDTFSTHIDDTRSVENMEKISEPIPVQDTIVEEQLKRGGRGRKTSAKNTKSKVLGSNNEKAYSLCEMLGTGSGAETKKVEDQGDTCIMSKESQGINSKRKRTGRKTASKEKKVDQTEVEKTHTFVESAPNILKRNTIRSIESKENISGNSVTESDVYTFAEVVSPSVSKTRKKVGKTSRTVRQSKTNASKTKTASLRVNGNEKETVRTCPQLDDSRYSLNISVEELEQNETKALEFSTGPELSSTSVYDIYPAIVHNTNTNCSQYCDIQEVLVDNVDLFKEHDAFNESIELLRGNEEKKTASKKGRGVRMASKRNVQERILQNEMKAQSDADTQDNFGNTELLRSSNGLSKLVANLHFGMEDANPVVSSSESSRSSSGNEGFDTIAILEKTYQQICHFPGCPLFNSVCQTLAQQYIDTNPVRAAFLLSEAVAVTFRHQSILNIGRRIRKLTKEDKLPVEGRCIEAEAKTEIRVLEQVRDILSFNKTEENFQLMVNSIPEDWVVCQVCLVDPGTFCSQLLVTRCVYNQAPDIFRLPGCTTPVGRSLLSDFSAIISSSQESVKILDKTEWWQHRRTLDNKMHGVVETMETVWLGHWKAVFLSRPKISSSNCVLDVLQQICDKVRIISKKTISPSVAEVLLLSVSVLTEHQMKLAVSEILSLEKKAQEVLDIMSYLKLQLKMNPLIPNPEGHTILILDKNVQHLPWESMAILQNKSVSRLPSMYHLHTQLSFLQTQESSVLIKGVNSRSTYYVLNPDNNLPNTQITFEGWFEKELGWKGVVGRPPTQQEFTEAITAHDLMIYCGHGSGSQYLNKDELQHLRARAVAILMGCSSGRLQVHGQLEATGVMISYFLAGCPCIVANLWDVTDRDIDRFLESFLKIWLNSENGTLLTDIVTEARKACKLPHLIGYAPVVYGFPVRLQRKRDNEIAA
ncbi:hypothetical protein CHS0354_017898 [Potamilus streckersoni]|uniref:separase n=1 Tax=Potamilus streckersoni TaxID=2493646 RepID=A0AAE0T2P0_9BIVA|nr:hypothetical protein CHS0354_017898 [Potamilus streckersoni]